MKKNFIFCIIFALTASLLLPFSASASVTENARCDEAFLGKDDTISNSENEKISEQICLPGVMTASDESNQEIPGATDEQLGTSASSSNIINTQSKSINDSKINNLDTQNEKLPEKNGENSDTSGDISQNTDENSKDNHSLEKALKEEKNDKSTNPFSELYNSLIVHLGDIFACLSFVLGLIIAMYYKKSLMPGISGAASAIKGSIDDIYDSTQASQAQTNAFAEALSSEIKSLSGIVDNISAELSTIKQDIHNEDSMLEIKKNRAVLLVQIDMLYNIFISSALPEYQKEKVGKQVIEMKKELGENE